MSKRIRYEPSPHTGWSPGMLQDDCRKLSRWLSNRIDSRRHAREAAEAIIQMERLDDPNRTP